MSLARFAAVCGLLALSTVPLSFGSDLGDDGGAQAREATRIRFLEDQQPVQRLEQMATTPCVNGLAGTYPCSDVDLMAFLPLSQIGGGSGNDIWGWTDPLTGREYALMGRSSGTSFVDITDASNPVYLGNLPTHTSNSSWRDIKVYSDHAFVVSEAFNHGMQVFDLTQLRNVTSPPVTFAETAHYDNIGSAHNIAINEDTGYAYIVGSSDCNEGPHFVDISVPASPVFAGCHTETYYTHDTQCVVYNGPDTAYTGREICINSNETRINVIDVTDKSASTLISETFYAQDGYTHQGWLTEDQRYYLLGDELDEQQFGHNTRTRIFDMIDLDDPFLLGTHDSTNSAIDHNMYTHNGLVYQANYRAGLRILDLADVGSGSLTEIAYFDIYPSSNSASFNGAWSVYPYFDSGTVVVSGIEQGLFVLRPTLGPSFGVDVDPVLIDVCDPGSGSATVDLQAYNDYVGNVSLAATGLPAGTSASFDVNPVVVPGASTLTVNAAGSTAGTYSFTVEADDGTVARTQNVQMRIATSAPAQPTALAPFDGGTNVSRSPKMQWSTADDAELYILEIATDAAFTSIVYTIQTANTVHTVTQPLVPETLHYWRVRGVNGCGGGLDSVTSTFTTLTVPDVLLVDDDDNGPDVVLYYTSALISLGRTFDVWDTGNTDNEPSETALEYYDTVIWFTGDEFGGAAGPGGGGEEALSAWLDKSRCLLISSQDYFYDRNLTGLMTDYLGVGAVSETTTATANGSGAFSGLGPFTLDYPYSNFSDSLTPDPSGAEAFAGDLGMAGIEKDTGYYRTAYLGFGLEALPTAADREAVVAAFMSWCDPLPGLDGDNDGIVNADDCAPGDASATEPPSSSSGLTLSDAASNNISWSASTAPGGSVTYDVVRSDDPSSFLSATCVETASADTVATEVDTPAPGVVWYYLIRTQNACGSTLGDFPGREAGTCP